MEINNRLLVNTRNCACCTWHIVWIHTLHSACRMAIASTVVTSPWWGSTLKDDVPPCSSLAPGSSFCRSVERRCPMKLTICSERGAWFNKDVAYSVTVVMLKNWEKGINCRGGVKIAWKIGRLVFLNKLMSRVFHFHEKTAGMVRIYSKKITYKN